MASPPPPQEEYLFTVGHRMGGGWSFHTASMVMNETRPPFSVAYHSILSVRTATASRQLHVQWLRRTDGKVCNTTIPLLPEEESVERVRVRVVEWLEDCRAREPMQLSCCSVPAEPSSTVAELLRICLIVNPESGQGKGKRVAQRFRTLLCGVEDRISVEVELVTQKAGEALEFVRDTLGDIDVIVCVGGDGTLYEVINGLMQRGDELRSTVMLGIVPAGTGNGLAVSLGIDSVEEAVLRIIHGSRRPLDLMKITGQDFSATPLYAFLQVAFGQMCEVDFDTEWMRRLGDVRFLFGIVYTLARYSAYPAKLTYSGQEEEETETAYAMIGGFNTPALSADFQGGPRSKIDDGFIDLMVLPHSIGRRQFFGVINAMQSGTQCDLDACQYYKVTEFSIEAGQQPGGGGRFDIDGECVFAKSRVNVACLPSHCYLLA